jgi:ATP-dependent DNA helicase DinG
VTKNPDSPTTYIETMVQIKARVPSYEDRPQQDAAANLIEQTITDGSISVIQAGTGTGKANAGLIPAILASVKDGKRAVYATATKALQSQLADKDLPFLEGHLTELGITFEWAVLKGFSNYACHQKLLEHPNPALASEIAKIMDDDPEHTGEREYLPRMDEDDWWRMTIASDDCPGKKECAFGEVCRPHGARSRASTSDLVVTNHALVALDAQVAANTDGAASLLGEYDVLILDEGHEFEEFVSGNLEWKCSPGTVRNFVAQLRGFGRANGFDVEDVALDLNGHEYHFFNNLPVDTKQGVTRLRHIEIVNNPDPYTSLLDSWRGAFNFLTSDEINSYMDGQSKRVTGRWKRLVRTASNQLMALQALLLTSDDEMVRSVEATPKGNVLSTRPVSVANWCRENVWETGRASVLLSATILIDGKSDFITERLGLPAHNVLDVGTPFNYECQALLYVPRHLSDPTKQKVGWAAEMGEEMLRLVTASSGRALLLFTSTSQMRATYEQIGSRIEALGYETEMQGRRGGRTNADLMEWFKTETSSVLFATRSFFTGASFEGETLSLLVIDKLPFPVPTEPVFQARSELIAKQTGDTWASFNRLSVPMMTLPLQQGVGRLIRTKKDVGVMAILDPRIQTKGYGKTILGSLPPAPLTASYNDVVDFVEAKS